MAVYELSERVVVALEDIELVERLFATVAALDDDERIDDLYRLIAEALERWRPDLEWQQVVRGYRDMNETNAIDECEAHLESLARRQAMRLRAKAWPLDA